MGEALGIFHNQPFFVGAWNIYLSDDSGLLLICYAMISFLLTGDQTLPDLGEMTIYISVLLYAASDISLSHLPCTSITEQRCPCKWL